MDVKKHKISINWFPDIKYNVNENDIYLAVVAEFTKSKYIITQDQGFTDAYNDTFPNKNAYACSPRKFISLEKFFLTIICIFKMFLKKADLLNFFLKINAPNKIPTNAPAPTIIVYMPNCETDEPLCTF